MSKKEMVATSGAPKVGNLRLIVGKEAIEAQIASIKKRGAKWVMDVHQCALSVLWHMEHGGKNNTFCGDYTGAIGLIDAMPKGAKTNALIDWFCAYGKLKFDQEAKTLAYDKSKETDIESGALKPWNEFRPEPAYRPINLTESVKDLIIKAQGRAKRQKDETDPTKLKAYKQDKIDANLLEGLAALINLDLSTMEIVTKTTTTKVVDKKKPAVAKAA